MSDFEFLLPDLGEGISSAEVVSWSVAVGATVTAHDTLVVVETDKAQVELPAPVSGVLTEHGAEEGVSIKVGQLIARFDATGSGNGSNGSAKPQVPANGEVKHAAADGEVKPPAASATTTEPHPASAESSPGTEQSLLPAQRTAGAKRPLAAPTVRKLAVERGIDLGTIEGTGPGGRIVKADVLRAGEAPAMADSSAAEASTATGATDGAAQAAMPASHSTQRPTFTQESTRTPLRGLRRTIARRMTEIQQTVPQVSGHLEVDVTDLAVLLEELAPLAQAEGVRLTWTPLFGLATIHALREFPALNGAVDMEREEIIQYRDIHLGIATNIDGGLLVPVVRDVGRLSLVELAAEIARVGEAARNRTAAAQELRGSTITITNYGAVGGWFGTMMVNTPELAIVGFGRVVQRPLVVDGAVAVRSVVPLSMTMDHRVIDGALGAQFTSAIKRRLEQPNLLLLGARHGHG